MPGIWVAGRLDQFKRGRRYLVSILRFIGLIAGREEWEGEKEGGREGGRERE